MTSVCVHMALLSSIANENIIVSFPNTRQKPAHNRMTLISLKNCCTIHVSLHNGIRRSSNARYEQSGTGQTHKELEHNRNIQSRTEGFMENPFLLYVAIIMQAT